ncbi:hypothetical protein FGB62_230g011 [Gracilaria domingensis]|nr:hypothetical protein FGB62_230g011 [Gracilaria domingensis]
MDIISRLAQLIDGNEGTILDATRRIQNEILNIEAPLCTEQPRESSSPNDTDTHVPPNDIFLSPTPLRSTVEHCGAQQRPSTSSNATDRGAVIESDANLSRAPRTHHTKEHDASSIAWEVNRVMFRGDKYYGAKGFGGGESRFHEIQIDTLNLFLPRVGTFLTRIAPINPQVRNVRRDQSPEPFWFTASKDGSNEDGQKTALTRLKAYLQRYPGFVVTVSKPAGARPSDGRLSQYVTRGFGPIFRRAVDGECMEVAIINAVHALCGSDFAAECEQKIASHSIILRSLLSLNQLVQSLSSGLQLQRGTPEMKSFENLAQLLEGVHVVRVAKEGRRLTESFRHALVVDSNRGLILDGAEHFPLRLCRESLHLCAGGHPKFSRILEVVRLNFKRGYREAQGSGSLAERMHST